VGRSPEAMSWRILARSSLWFMHDKQQEGGHGAPRNTDARLDRATVSPGLGLAGLSTLQPDSSFGAHQRGDVCSWAPLLNGQILGSRESAWAPKLIAPTYLAVPMIGMSRTRSPSSGTGISSCPRRVIRRSEPRGRGASRLGVGSRSDTGGSNLTSAPRPGTWLGLGALAVLVDPDRRHRARSSQGAWALAPGAQLRYCGAAMRTDVESLAAFFVEHRRCGRLDT
jgi:hypothetical protein